MMMVAKPHGRGVVVGGGAIISFIVHHVLAHEMMVKEGNKEMNWVISSDV